MDSVIRALHPYLTTFGFSEAGVKCVWVSVGGSATATMETSSGRKLYLITDGDEVFMSVYGSGKFLLRETNGVKSAVRKFLMAERRANNRKYHVLLFELYIRIMSYIDSNSDGYSYPYLETLKLKADIKELMSALDKFGMSKKYKEILNKNTTIFC